MIALKIEDLKHFTGQLFAGEAFDHWQVRDVSIVTFNTFTIDGFVPHTTRRRSAGSKRSGHTRSGAVCARSAIR